MVSPARAGGLTCDLAAFFLGDAFPTRLTALPPKRHGGRVFPFVWFLPSTSSPMAICRTLRANTLTASRGMRERFCLTPSWRSSRRSNGCRYEEGTRHDHTRVGGYSRTTQSCDSRHVCEHDPHGSGRPKEPSGENRKAVAVIQTEPVPNFRWRFRGSRINS